MKSLKNLTGDSLEQLIDYQVVDQNGDEIGTLHSLWSEPDTGAVEFLGVKTGWLFGHNHVVPAEKAELDESENVVRLPYTSLFIKEAPSMSADAEISEAEEANIYQYYGLDRTGPSIETSTMVAPAASGMATSGLPEVAGAAALAGSGSTFSGNPAPKTTGGDDAARWRRTSRSLMNDAVSGGIVDKSNPVRDALGDMVGGDESGTTASTTAASPGSYGTSNLYGSTGDTTPVAEDSLGDASEASVGTSGSTLAAGSAARTSGTAATNSNPDLITGEPGSHPLGTGAGALSAGAAGMAVGSFGGPVGAVIGGIVGAVGGAYVGKGIAESIDPTEEDAHWRSNYRSTSYFENDYEYADYAPAYRVGYEGFGRYGAEGRDYHAAEPDLQRDYSQGRGSSRLEWEKAKSATRDAWERLKAKTSHEAK